MIRGETVLLWLAQVAPEGPRVLLLAEPRGDASGMYFINALYSVISLYMLAILVSWTAPFLSFELRRGPLVWVRQCTEPYIKMVRGILPDLGPFDAAPLVSLLLVYVLRLVLAGH